MKKATGIIRQIDQDGRIVLPKELRQTLSIEEGDSLVIYVNDDDEIILKKYQTGCLICATWNTFDKEKGNGSVKDVSILLQNGARSEDL